MMNELRALEDQHWMTAAAQPHKYHSQALTLLLHQPHRASQDRFSGFLATSIQAVL